MVPNTTNAPAHSELLPERHPQHDLFVCDVADAILKDVIAEMEHPFYSLSKKPETRVRRYEHNGNWLEVTPSVKGQATIYDKDILIYCISQLMAKLKAGERVERRVRINSRDLLMFTNRGTSGRDYMALSEALSRLAGTQISTNIRVGEDEEEFSTFHLIEAATLRRKHGLDGRLLWCEVTISDWIFDAIRANDVLTLHRDYFRLRKPLERRIYELARKHCGRQEQWSISLTLLLKKSGSGSSEKRFRQLIKNIVKHDHLPDYRISYNETGDKVTFHNREKWWKGAESDSQGFPALPTSAYERARAAAPGYDVYYLEQEWRDHWVTSGKPKLSDPDRAFVGFCKKRYAARPSP